MVSKTTFKDSPQSEPALDEYLTQQLAHIKKWLFVISGMVAMFWLIALSDFSFTSQPWLFFPFVWFLLWMIPLGISINLALGSKWRQAPLRQRRELIIWPAALSWLAISAFLFNEARATSFDSMITILLTIPIGFGLWSLNRWLLEKAYADQADDAPDTLFP